MSLPFSFDLKSQYDQSTYKGRYLHFKKITYLLDFFVSDKIILEYKNSLNQYKIEVSKGKVLSNEESNKLWRMKNLVDSSFNSDGELVPKLLRMNAFAIANFPITFGLICLPATRVNLLFFNLLNQTFNAAFNYFNGSKNGDNKTLVISYLLAISSSIGSAILFRRILGDPGKSLIKNIITRIFPSCIAGFLNLLFMRSSYAINGINITDKNGNIIGRSKNAGAKAIFEGGVSRFLIPLPLALNFIIMKRVNSMNLNKVAVKVFDATLCSALLYFGLPFSIAVFDQNSKAKTSFIEKDLFGKLNSNGYKDEWVYYNKGL